MSTPEIAAPTERAENFNIRVQIDAEKLAVLPDAVRDPIMAFHAEIIGKPEWNWKRVQDEIGYDSSTMSRVFRGKYVGSYENVATAIANFFDKQAAVAAPSEFVRTRIAATIFNAIDYARANRVGALVIGPSRVGKTAAALDYNAGRDDRKMPKSVYIQIPPVGGVQAVRSALSARLGVAPRLAPAVADAGIVRAIGRTRIVIVDEAHRLLASGKSGHKSLDYLRWVFDEAGCGFCILATVRFEDNLLESRYMFEQFIGRIEAPIRVGEEIGPEDWQPIADQFIPGGVKALSAETAQALAKIAASSGHFASIVHVMHLAQRDAGHRKETLADRHVANAIRWRREKFNQKFFFLPKGEAK